MAVGLERQLDERRRRAHPAGDRDRRQRIGWVAVVPGTAVGRQDEQLLQVDLGAVHVGLADQRSDGTTRRAASASSDRSPLRAAPCHDGAPSNGVRVSRPNSTPTPRAVVCGRTTAPEAFSSLANPTTASNRPGPTVGLRQPETDRAAALAADLAEQCHLGSGVVEAIVVTLAEPHRALEDSRPVPAEHLGERQQFVRGRVRARHRPAIGHTMQERAAGRHAERARRHRLVDEPRHRDHVVAGGRSLVETALAHHVGAQRTVADQTTGVRALRQSVDRVVVLAVRLPVPRQ